MESEGYIRFEKGTTATSKAIYNVYCKWCEENAEKPMSFKTVLGYLKQNSEELGIEPSTNIPIDGGKKARGFKVFLQRYVQMAHKIHIIINVQNHVYMRILQIYKGFYISHMCMNTRIRMICRIHHF